MLNYQRVKKNTWYISRGINLLLTVNTQKRPRKIGQGAELLHFSLGTIWRQGTACECKKGHTFFASAK